MVADLDAGRVGHAPHDDLADDGERVGEIERQPHGPYLFVPGWQARGKQQPRGEKNRAVRGFNMSFRPGADLTLLPQIVFVDRTSSSSSLPCKNCCPGGRLAT